MNPIIVLTVEDLDTNAKSGRFVMTERAFDQTSDHPRELADILKHHKEKLTQELTAQ